MNKTQTRDHITALFKSFAGQGNALVIPRPYIEFCQGDILAALFLSQLLYWTDRTSDPDGWIAKSYEEWHAEIGLTEYQVKRAIKGDKRRKNIAFSLQDVGVETALRKSDFHHGAATLHYRVNEEKLRAAVVTFLADLNNVQNWNQTMLRTSNEQCQERIYIESETTPETIDIAASASADAESVEEPELASESITAPPVRKRSPRQQAMDNMVEALIDAQKLDRDTLNSHAYGGLRSAAKSLMESKATPSDIPGLYAWCQKQSWSESMTEHAMAKWWPRYVEYRSKLSKPLNNKTSQHEAAMAAAMAAAQEAAS